MTPALKTPDEPNGANKAKRRPLRVAVCGEVCSGKSALVNGLLRQELLPDFFGEPSRPEVRIQSGGEPGWTGVFADGRTEALDPEAPVPLQDGLIELIIRTGEQTPHLEGIEIIELPPLYDEHVSEAEIARVGQFDLLIWSTIGSQAWRLSEKTILDLLGPTRPKHALMAITRSDKFRKAADRQKVFDRVNKNAMDYFDEILLTSASPRRVKAATTDDKAWEDTGLAAVYRWIQSHLDALPEGAVEEPGDIVALSDYREGEDKGSAPVAEAPKVAAPKPVETPEPPSPAMPAAPPEPVAKEEPKGPKPDPRIIVTVAYSLDDPSKRTVLVGEDSTAAAYIELNHAVALIMQDSAFFGGLQTCDIQIGEKRMLFGPTEEKGVWLLKVYKKDAMTTGAAHILFWKRIRSLSHVDA